MKNKKDKQPQIRCGTCDHWCRGGIGHGRGGGSCIKYNLSRVASNTCGIGPHGCHSSFEKVPPA